jgi:hypothetical protein
VRRVEDSPPYLLLLLQRFNEPNESFFTFTADAVIRTGQFHQFFGENGKAAAAEDERAIGFFANGLAEGNQVREKSFLPADEDVVNVPQGKPDELRLKSAEQVLQLISGIGLAIEPADFMASAAQGSIQIGQPEWKNRVGRGAAIGANQKELAGHASASEMTNGQLTSISGKNCAALTSLLSVFVNKNLRLRG